MLRTRFDITSAVGGPYLCVFHYTAAVENQSAADNAILKGKTFWDELSSLWLVADTVTNRSNVDVVNPGTGELTGQFTVSVATFAGALSGSDRLPHATQGLVRWSTNAFVGGRRVKGRTFYPNLLESQSVDPGVPGGALTGVTPLNGIAGQLTAGDATFVIWSRPKLDPDTGATIRVGTTSVVTGGSIAPYFAVLRSRRD